MRDVTELSVKFGGRLAGRFECSCCYCLFFLCFCFCFCSHTFLCSSILTSCQTSCWALWHHAYIAWLQSYSKMAAFFEFHAFLAKDFIEFGSTLEAEILTEHCMSSFRLAKRKKVPIFEWTSPLIKVKSVMNWWKNFRWTPCLYFSIPFTVVHFFPDKCHGVLAKMGLLKVSKCPESLSYLELINFKLRALTLERNINISDQVSLYDNLKKGLPRGINTVQFISFNQQWSVFIRVQLLLQRCH